MAVLSPSGVLSCMFAVCILITGCATHSPNSDGGAPDRETAAGQSDSDNSDPLEGFNRAMFTFNDKLDDYFLKPVAKGYRAVMPSPLRSGVANFFYNLGEPGVMLNNLFQGKLSNALSDLGRFLTNSTIGIYGLFDVASHVGMQKHDEDFGQTLGVWGVGDGAYLVLPFFGPSSLRDGTGRIGDYYTYPPNYMEEKSTRDKLFLLRGIDTRSQLLDASDILEQAAGDDVYLFVREAYLQRRRNQIYDGNPPELPPPDFLFEESPAAEIGGAQTQDGQSEGTSPAK